MRLGLITKCVLATVIVQGAAFSASPALGQTPCSTPGGPDVIVGDLTDPGSNYASSGGIEAFDIGTTSCNQGDQNLQWVSNTNQHPVIGQNLYRLKDGRIEQIGQSWLKHGFTALAQNLCCTCNNPGTGSLLGVGCSDPYCCGLNGQQGGLGPKWEVNAHTGAYPYPFTSPSFSGSIARRLQVRITDLDPALNAGALYYGEAQYVTPDDAAAGNQNNNVSYRRVNVTGSGSAWNIAMTATTQREKAAIQAWKVSDAAVTETQVQIASDGLIIVSSKATNLGGNQYHYEFAVFNMNSDRAIGSFSIPIPSGAAVTNVGFHDVDYHSGDGPGSVNYSGTDWPATVGATSVSWACQTQTQNPSANALRWGTMYNFRFDVNASAGSGNATLGLWKPGTPTSVNAAVQIPTTLLGPADCNNNSIPDATDIANGTSQDCNANNVPDECDTFTPVPIARQLVASGFSSPIYVAQAPGDNTRLFVVQQAGQIRIRDLVGNTTLATPFLDLGSIISVGGEQGLLGLAFHPQYQSNGFFYVDFIDLNGDTVIARYTRSGDPNVANAGSQVILKTIAQPNETNHKAGCLQFGKDGMLYVAVGDGGGGNDQHGAVGNAQNTATLLGKMLRLDVNNTGGGFIPANNPFVGVVNDPTSSIPDEIWAIGMRNPWRFSFDKLKGDMYIGDVGQDAMEEIDFEPAGFAGGRNYGWRCMEGTACTGLSGCTCNAAGLTLPIHTYTHASLPAGAVSETGGYVYRGCAMPSLHGRYFYGDYGQDFIKSFKYTTGGGAIDHQDHTVALQNIVAPVSFGQDNAGELYVVSYVGNIYKIVEQTGPVCGNGIVEAGEQCDDNNGNPGDGCFNCQFEPGNNDNCSGALVVCTGGYSDTLIGATNDGSASCGTATTTPDKWFKYVAVNSGVLTVNTCGTDDLGGTDAGIDTVLSIHSGCPGTTANQLACNDDWTGAGSAPPAACTGLDAGATTYDSSVQVSVTAGNTYFVRVSIFGGGTPVAGAFALNVTAPLCFPDCNNNGISDATDIANATSLDCAHDGIPDECQVTPTIVNYDAIPATPILIPDNNIAGTTHTFNVPDHGTVQDLNLGLRITHTWNGDLIVKLTHGGVTGRILIDRPGYTGTGFGFNNDGFNGFAPASPLLDDEGTGGTIEARNVAAGVTSPPSYTPNQTLAGFDGQDRFGVWTLNVSDNAGTDTGSLVRWLLQFSAPGVVQPCPPDCNGNGIPDATDIANLTSADCDVNTVPDECQIAANFALDCDGGPVGIRPPGASIFASTCSGCHNVNGQGGGSFPGPNIRNRGRRFIWTELLPPTTHPGGAHPEYTQQDYANLEAFLADAGSKGRPDNILDTCQPLVDCNANGQRDACELENGTAVDLDYNGVPDTCECIGPATGNGNGDGAVNGKDIRNFVSAILAGSTSPTDVCAYDFSDNNVVGAEDVPGMITKLLTP